MHLKVMIEKMMHHSKSQHGDIENHMLLFTFLATPPTIEEDLVLYIEEQTREQRMSRLWKALHYGRITSSMFGDVLQSGDKPASLINHILHGSNFD